MNRDGLTLEIVIGTRTFAGRLPLHPNRFRLWEAYDEVASAGRRSTPVSDEEDEELRALVTDEDPLEEVLGRGLELVDGVIHRVTFDGDLVDSHDVAAVCIAAIGLCWDDKPLKVEAYRVRKGVPKLETFLLPGHADRLLRVLDRDVVSFGEHVESALAELGLLDPVDLYRAGAKLREAVVASIPRSLEVEEKSGNSGARGETSTGSTSSPV